MAVVGPAMARDDLFIVPRDAVELELQAAELLANDAIGAVFEEAVSTARGSLTWEGSTLTYSPGPDFARLGADSFQYRFRTANGPAWSTVHLVADLRGRGDLGGTTAGGNTALVLDPGRICPSGLCESGQGATRVLVSGSGAGSGVVFELRHAEDELGGQEIWLWAAETAGPGRDGVRIPIPNRRIPVEVNWWISRSAGAHDGGYVLLVDGVLAASSSDLPNHGLGIHGWATGTSVSAGEHPAVTLTRAHASEDRPIFPPLLADHFEAPAPKGWADLPPSQPGEPSLVSTSSSAAKTGQQGLQVGLSGVGNRTLRQSLRDAEGSGIRRFNVRLQVGLGLGCGGQAGPRQPYSNLQLLSAVGNDGGSPFLVLLEPLFGSRFRLAAKALQDGGGEAQWTASSPILQGQAEVLLSWWAASGGEGGLVLEVPGQFRRELSLDNASQRLIDMLVGPHEPQPSSHGVMCLDSYESWR